MGPCCHLYPERGLLKEEICRAVKWARGGRDGIARMLMADRELIHVSMEVLPEQRPEAERLFATCS
jgi:hypothetical protein